MKYLVLSLLFAGSLSAEKVIWSGEVKADGTPTAPVELSLNHKYKIQVSGVINLGKYFQGETPLADDAVYEFIANSDKVTSPLKNFRNSLDISMGDEKYHPDHIYFSKPFVARQSRIHFWIDDIDYGDNTGSLGVDIIQLD